jgi:hypothetical protein
VDGRRRLQDEYQALRSFEQCVIELQREERLHSSVLITLNVQLDLRVPDFSGLNSLLKTKKRRRLAPQKFSMRAERSLRGGQIALKMQSEESKFVWRWLV